MRFLLLLCLAFHSQLLLANARIHLSFENSEVQQGEIQNATLEMGLQSAQNFPIQKLKGQQPGGVIYIHKISPLLRSEASDKLSAEASVVFLKVPEKTSTEIKLDNQTVILDWSDVKVVPTQADGKLIFESFEIPDRSKILELILLGLVLVFSLSVGWFLYKKYESRKIQKRKREALRNTLLSASSYEEIIEVWENKHEYFIQFPQVEPPFRKCEQVLFKYLFKPHRTEEEKKEIQKAYRVFTEEIREKVNGV